MAVADSWTVNRGRPAGRAEKSCRECAGIQGLRQWRCIGDQHAARWWLGQVRSRPAVTTEATTACALSVMFNNWQCANGGRGKLHTSCLTITPGKAPSHAVVALVPDEGSRRERRALPALG